MLEQIKALQKSSKFTVCFDIDGTLCTNTEGDYASAEPILENIRVLNELFDQGNRIVLFTARGTTTGINWRALTERQMNSWGVRYHELLFGKPFAHVYIDDKGLNVVDLELLRS